MKGVVPVLSPDYLELKIGDECLARGPLFSIKELFVKINIRPDGQVAG